MKQNTASTCNRSMCYADMQPDLRMHAYLEMVHYIQRVLLQGKHM